MRVLMTGATGLIGRAVLQQLCARGDQVVALVRNPEAARQQLPASVQLHHWDHTREVPPAAMQGVQAVLHLAGEPILPKLIGGRWTAARKAGIRDSRILGTQRLAAALTSSAATVFVHGSAVGIYGDRGSETLTAESEPGTGFLADLVGDWEDQAMSVRQARPGIRVAIIRTGIVLSGLGGILGLTLPLFRRGLGSRLGDGSGQMSWIHLDDLVSLFVFALDNPAAIGVLEGVAPEPVSNAEWTQELCRALGTRQGPPVPSLLIRALYGELSTVLLASTRVLPRRTLELGFVFTWPKFSTAIVDVVKRLRL